MNTYFNKFTHDLIMAYRKYRPIDCIQYTKSAKWQQVSSSLRSYLPIYLKP